MANVPAVLIFGDHQVNGGRVNPFSGIDGAANYHTQKSRDLPAHRVVPDDPTTGAPTAGALSWYPWFDGTAGDTDYVVASSTATRVTVTPSPGWTVDEHVDKRIMAARNTGLGFRVEQAPVLANGADYIDVAGWTNPADPPAALDTLWFAEGRWRDYAMHAAWRTTTEFLGGAVPKRGGSTWQTREYGSGIPRLGLGYDAGLIRELYENVWTTAPYFQCAKFFTDVQVLGGWDDGGTARTTFTDELARYNAAWSALASGDTLVWEYVILDMSQLAVQDWITTPGNQLLYWDALGEMIAWLRTTLGNASLRVLLVNHDARLRQVDAPTYTAFANGAHNYVAIQDPLVTVVNLDGMDFSRGGVDAEIPTWIPGEDNEFYSVDSYINRAPREMRKVIELLEAGTAPESSGAVPMYLMIGDSITFGEITEAWAITLDSPTMTPGVRDTRQRIYNRGTQQCDAYDLGVNSNTSGTVGAFGGPEFSLLVELMGRHPNTGVVLVKRGGAASTLIADLETYSEVGGSASGGRWSKTISGEHYDEFKTDVENAIQYVNTVLEKQVELMGIFVCLGTNDQAVAGGGALFSSALAAFVANLREDYGTHTTGRETPIIWRRPQLGTATAIPAESIAIRAALDAFAANDEQFVSMDVDDLERQDGDNLHETPDAQITHGQRNDAELDEIALPNCP